MPRCSRPDLARAAYGVACGIYPKRTFARLSAGIARLDQGDFIEGHCLNAAMSARVPPNMIGKRLSQRQAKLLLDRLEHSRGAKAEQKRRGAKSLSA